MSGPAAETSNFPRCGCITGIGGSLIELPGTPEAAPPFGLPAEFTKNPGASGCCDDGVPETGWRENLDPFRTADLLKVIGQPVSDVIRVISCSAPDGRERASGTPNRRLCVVEGLLKPVLPLAQLLPLNIGEIAGHCCLQ